MSSRLQVLIPDAEMAEIQQIAQAGSHSGGRVGAPDIEQMNREIESRFE